MKQIFEKAKPLLKFFVEKGHDIGESSALELYATLQLASANKGSKFVVMICDGIENIERIWKKLEKFSLQDKFHRRMQPQIQVIMIKLFGFTHNILLKKEEQNYLQNLQVLIKAKQLYQMQEQHNNYYQDREFQMKLIIQSKNQKGKALMVCMAGRTSLMAANVLAEKGIITDSLIGGITELPEARNSQLSELVKQASQFLIFIKLLSQ